MIELAGDDRCKASKNIEVIPLDHCPCRGCKNSPRQALSACVWGGGRWGCLHSHKASPLFGKRILINRGTSAATQQMETSRRQRDRIRRTIHHPTFCGRINMTGISECVTTRSATL